MKNNINLLGDIFKDFINVILKHIVGREEMIVIRKMEPSEAGAVKKLGQKTFRGIEKLFVSNPKDAMVAVLDDKIVGGIIIKYIESNGNKIGYFDGAFIDANYHGRGIGGMLYEKTTQYLWEEGCTAQTALVKDDNVGSWKLFLNNGFCETSFLEGVRLLGLRTMMRHYLTTPFFVSNGMEFYLSVAKGQVKPKEIGSLKQIFMFVIANILLILFRFMNNKSKQYQ